MASYHLSPRSLSTWAPALAFSVMLCATGLTALSLSLLLETKPSLVVPRAPSWAYFRTSFIVAAALAVVLDAALVLATPVFTPVLLGAFFTALFVDSYYSIRVLLWYRSIAPPSKLVGLSRRARQAGLALVLAMVSLFIGSSGLISHAPPNTHHSSHRAG